MPLKDANCRNAKPQDKPYRLYDEQGLYLEVQPNGGRYWRLIVQLALSLAMSFGECLVRVMPRA